MPPPTADRDHPHSAAAGPARPSQWRRDLGLLHDRRASLGLLAGAGLWLAGCRQGSAQAGHGPAGAEEAGWGSTPQISGTGADGLACVALPGETEGPFAADGGGGGGRPSVLGDEALRRSDIRTSFGSLTGTAPGVPLELELILRDVDRGCAPLAGRAVYLWHCDAAARYSLYELPQQNYLRGMQVADSGGSLRFRTIVPGAYRGRFPHLHLEVFESAGAASSGAGARLTTQMVVPAQVCRRVYDRSSLYPGSAANLAALPLARDMVFADNTPAQLAAQTLEVGATPTGGFRAVATVGLTAR